MVMDIDKRLIDKSRPTFNDLGITELQRSESISHGGLYSNDKLDVAYISNE